MKKLGIYFLFIIILCGCFSSCSNSKTNSSDYVELDDIEYLEQEGESEGEETIDDLENDFSEEEILDSKKINKKIIYGTSFSDGVAFVLCDDSRVYAINNNGEILYEKLGNYTLNDFQKIDKIGKYVGGIMIEKNALYNKKGEIVANPEEKDYDGIIGQSKGGFSIAYKIISDKKYQIGILDGKGNWKDKLSDNNPIVNEFKDYYPSQITTEPLDNDRVIIKVSSYTKVFDLKKNIFDEDYIINPIYESVVEKFPNYSLIEVFEDEKAFLANTGKDETKVFDLDGNLLLDFSPIDKTAHTMQIIKYYKSGFILSTIGKGDLYNGKRYILLVDKQCKNVFEPIEYQEELEVSNLHPLKNGFLYKRGQQYCYYFLDGTQKALNDIFYVVGFNEGLSLVSNAVGEYYYINEDCQRVIG